MYALKLPSTTPANNRSVTDELDILRRASGIGEDEEDVPLPRAPKAKAEGTVSGKAKTTFQVGSKIGSAKCTAANGRLEIRLDRDFSALDRRRLEAALRLMLDLQHPVGAWLRGLIP